MGFFHRLVDGVARQITAIPRAIISPLTAMWNEGGTIIDATKTLFKGHPLDAAGEFIKGSFSNVGRMGADVAEIVPGVAFAEGFIRDKGMFESGGGLGLT